MDRDDILRALVRPLEWVPYHPLGLKGKWGNGLFNYELKEGGHESFWWRRTGGNGWYQPEHDTSFDAAQAAAEADYRARIGAALDMEKVEKLVEAAKLLGRWCADNIPPDETMDRHLHDLDTALAAFRGQP